VSIYTLILALFSGKLNTSSTVFKKIFFSFLSTINFIIELV